MYSDISRNNNHLHRISYVHSASAIDPGIHSRNGIDVQGYLLFDFYIDSLTRKMGTLS